MKIFATIAKVVTALAAVAGAVYIIATYGDKIVAWAKNLLGRFCCCDDECCTCECNEDGECMCECDCNDCDCCACEEEEEEEEEAPCEKVTEAETVEAAEADFEA